MNPTRVIQVESSDDPRNHPRNDPRLSALVNLKDADLRRADLAGSRPVFVAEGELVVGRLIRSRYPIRTLLVAQSRLERTLPLIQSLPEDSPVFVASDKVMDEIVGFHFHQGLLAAAERLPPPSWKELAQTCRTLVVAENLANHDNVGGLFRDVAVLGGPSCGVLLSPGCCDPLYRKSVRVSMGNVLSVPFAWANPWPDVLAELATMGWDVLALTPREGARDIREIEAAGGGESGRRRAILLGAEGPGLSEEALAKATQWVRIGMTPGADSLNVAVAGAVALHRLVDPGCSASL